MVSSWVGGAAVAEATVDDRGLAGRRHRRFSTQCARPGWYEANWLTPAKLKAQGAFRRVAAGLANRFWTLAERWGACGEQWKSFHPSLRIVPAPVRVSFRSGSAAPDCIDVSSSSATMAIREPTS